MAEEHASTLLRQKAIEDKKMRELEKIRETLEVCLEEERQAKKDEEIVRQLQGWIRFCIYNSPFFCSIFLLLFLSSSKRSLLASNFVVDVVVCHFGKNCSLL